MIGQLPKALQVGEKSFSIRSDYRVALLIFEAFDDPDLNDTEKMLVCLNCLYETIPDDVTAAYERAVWFLDGGDTVRHKQYSHKVIDWKQDESMLFAAVNRVAGTETRSAEYLHWWTFLGYFSCISECLYADVLSLRTKRAKGKKLEKHEREFIRENKEIIDITPRLSAEELAEVERLKAILGE